MGFPGHVHDFPGGAGEVAPLHQQLLNIPAGLQGLPDGIAAGEQILVGLAFRHRRRGNRRYRAALLKVPVIQGPGLHGAGFHGPGSGAHGRGLGRPAVHRGWTGGGTFLPRVAGSRTALGPGLGAAVIPAGRRGALRTASTGLECPAIPELRAAAGAVAAHGLAQLRAKAVHGSRGLMMVMGSLVVPAALVGVVYFAALMGCILVIGHEITPFLLPSRGARLPRGCQSWSLSCKAASSAWRS